MELGNEVYKIEYNNILFFHKIMPAEKLILLLFFFIFTKLFNRMCANTKLSLDENYSLPIK